MKISVWNISRDAVLVLGGLMVAAVAKKVRCPFPVWRRAESADQRTEVGVIQSKLPQEGAESPKLVLGTSLMPASEEPPRKRAKAGFCEDGRQRSRCKECGGASICQHGRRRNTCKECGGSSICQHRRQHSQSKECGGSGICQHGRKRSQCKECC